MGPAFAINNDTYYGLGDAVFLGQNSLPRAIAGPLANGQHLLICQLGLAVPLSAPKVRMGRGWVATLSATVKHVEVLISKVEVVWAHAAGIPNAPMEYERTMWDLAMVNFIADSVCPNGADIVAGTNLTVPAHVETCRPVPAAFCFIDLLPKARHEIIGDNELNCLYRHAENYIPGNFTRQETL